MMSDSETLNVVARLFSASFFSGVDQKQEEESSALPTSGGLGKKAGAMTTTYPGDDSLLNLTSMSFPSLSLNHDDDDQHQEDCHHQQRPTTTTSQAPADDRKLAEEHAVNLLARSIIEHPQEEAGGGVKPIISLKELSNVVLQNIYSSFAILVDSRLHAYASLLARHALSLEEEDVDDDSNDNETTPTTTTASSVGKEKKEAAVRSIEEKLSLILTTGAQVSAESLTTSFEVLEIAEAEEELESSQQTTTTPGGVALVAPLVLHVTMMFVVPMHPSSSGGADDNEQVHNFAVSFQTDGKMTGIFTPGTTHNNNLRAVHIDLDTRELLNNMIEQASAVVSTIVKIASNNKEMGERSKTLPRSASFLAMPPPPSGMPAQKPSLAPQPDTEGGGGNSSVAVNAKFPNFIKPRIQPRHPNGLDLLSQAASQLPIVSPDLSSGSHHQPTPLIPSFRLEPPAAAHHGVSVDRDVSHLSFDQCADIVDTCLVGLDKEEPSSERPSKKARLE